MCRGRQNGFSGKRKGSQEINERVLRKMKAISWSLGIGLQDTPCCCGLIILCHHIFLSKSCVSLSPRVEHHTHIAMPSTPCYYYPIVIELDHHSVSLILLLFYYHRVKTWRLVSLLLRSGNQQARGQTSGIIPLKCHWALLLRPCDVLLPVLHTCDWVNPQQYRRNDSWSSDHHPIAKAKLSNRDTADLSVLTDQ